MPVKWCRATRIPLTASVVVATLMAGCGVGGSSSQLSGAPRGIVINRGGAVEVLDSTTTGTPHHVTGADLSGNSADPLQLNNIQQLAPNLVAGLRDGRLIVLDPAHADEPREVAPASDWFPDANQTGGWTVTQSLNEAPCPNIDGTAAGTARFRLERHRLSDGKLVTAPKILPCRMRPVADTPDGLLVSTLQDKVIDSGHGGVVPTDLQVVDRDDFRVLRTVRTGVAFIQAAHSIAIAAPADCKSGNCVVAIALNNGHPASLGVLNDGGTLIGAGLLDPTGNYFASAWASPTNGLRLVVCELASGAIKDVGPYTALNPGAPGALQDDMPAVWSGSRLLIANPQAGTLTTYQAETGEVLKRSGLNTGGSLQVWGAKG